MSRLVQAFEHLASTGISAATGDWRGTAKDALRLLGDIPWAELTPEQLLLRLVQRALVLAATELLTEYREAGSRQPRGVTALQTIFDREDIPLVADTFRNPEQIPAVQSTKRLLEYWLSSCTSSHSATAVAQRFPAYFVSALAREYGDHSAEYAAVKALWESPFFLAAERVRSWERYRIRLEREANSSVLGEPFSLKQIHVRPRAFTRTPAIGNERERRAVVDLREALDSWRVEADLGDTIRYLSGDPGSGKSSFALMYALSLLEKSERVFIVILKYFVRKETLRDSLVDYTQEDQPCPTDLLPDIDGERTLLVFDGLDELYRSESDGAKAAQWLLDQIRRECSRKNRRRRALEVLITGRPVAFQSLADDVLSRDMALHLMPYMISDSARDAYAYEPVWQLSDQREEWWAKYHELTGRQQLAYAQWPELTSQPLLNHLLALTCGDTSPGAPELQSGGQMTPGSRCKLYARLIHRIYRREWFSPGLTEGEASLEDFRSLLEVMALVSWQSNLEVVEIRALLEAVDHLGLTREVERQVRRYTGDHRALFILFYFERAAVSQFPNGAYEFTHPTFREYLTAQVLFGLLTSSAQRLRPSPQAPLGLRVTPQRVLEDWCRWCGRGDTAPSCDTFLTGLVELHEDPVALQQAAAEIINVFLLRLHKLLRFQELGDCDLLRKLRNVSVSLLFLHSTLARRTGNVVQLSWPSPLSAAEWLALLRRGAETQQTPPVFKMLNHIDFSSQDLSRVDLREADMEYAALGTLVGATLTRSVLTHVKFHGSGTAADFELAVLSEASVEKAELDFSRASFTRATLSHANLASTRLVRASFAHARMSHACLRAAQAAHADFSHAHLQSSELDSLAAPDATFDDSRLDRASFRDARLEHSRFLRAEGENVDFGGVDLETVDLAGAPRLSWVRQNERE